MPPSRTRGSNNAKPKRTRSLIVIFYLTCAILITLITISSIWIKSTTSIVSHLDITHPLNKRAALKFKSSFQIDKSISQFSSSSIETTTSVPKLQSNKIQEKNDDDDDWRSATSVFRQILKRAISSNETCTNLPNAKSKKFQSSSSSSKSDEFTPNTTNYSLPPPLGIVDAISSWLSKTNNTIPEEEMCRLPPSTSCNETQWTVILMSYADSPTVKKNHLSDTVIKMEQRAQTAEVILVWNSPRDTLTDDLLLRYDSSNNRKFRIFFALEHNLTNNLFNRYHPSLQPKTEALVYFDDDGPLLKKSALIAGFELWRRNSAVQIGAFPRKMRFDYSANDRMRARREEEIIVSERQVLNGWQSVSPYDVHGTERAVAQIRRTKYDGDVVATTEQQQQRDLRHPSFIPFCPSTGDEIAYSYKGYYPYRAHMTLPSASFIHRNYLCFLWHPVFATLRRFVLDHPTHADDITTSTIVSHVAGKAPRTYTRRTKTRLGDEVDKAKDVASKRLGIKMPNLMKVKDYRVLAQIMYRNMTTRAQFEMWNRSLTYNNNTSEAQPFDYENRDTTQQQQRRRLMWNHDDWADLRSEAIDSIIGFFGSINPGSVGYCLGSPTEYDAKKHDCDQINFSILEDLPWLNKGMVGYDQCPSMTDYNYTFFGADKRLKKLLVDQR